MKSLYSALFAALLIALAVNVSFSQITKTVHFTLTNASQTDTASFGITTAGAATKCIDASLDEAEQPPFPPAGALFSAFTDLTCLGNGLKWDLHPSAAAGTKDTFKLKLQLADETVPASLTWDKTAIAAIASAATMTGGGTTTDMLASGNLDWDPNDVSISSLRIILTLIPLTTGVVEQTGNQPATFALNQNYPNPFNPTTSIPFAIEKAGFTDVVVYNILGQKVATLVSEQMNPGTYTAKWNGTDDRGMAVSTGVYYVRMNSTFGNGESFTQMRKMLLMK